MKNGRKEGLSHFIDLQSRKEGLVGKVMYTDLRKDVLVESPEEIMLT
jgi:hypothetical protein